MAAWEVEFHDRFEAEFDEWPEAVREELLAQAGLLAAFGPSLGRPHADTLDGSAYANMKELRFAAADGVWRVAFAFDPNRRAILLVGGRQVRRVGEAILQVAHPARRRALCGALGFSEAAKEIEVRLWASHSE